MRRLSRLLKGECILMDASGFVYNNPACIQPDSGLGPEPAPLSRQDELAAAVKKARFIVESANRYVLKMHEQIRKQADDAYASAREEGFRKGYEEGHAQAFAENEHTLAKIENLMEEIDRGKDALFKRHEQDMADLALDIARKVVDAKLSENDETFLNIFRKAADGLHGQKTVRLQISPHEARFVTASHAYLLSLIRGAESLDIQVIEDLEPGACILESDDVLVDASAGRQLETLVQAIEAVR